MAGVDSNRSRDMADLDSEGSSDEDEVRVVKRIRIKSSAVHLEFSRQVVKLSNGSVEEKSKCNHCNVTYTGKNPTTIIKN